MKCYYHNDADGKCAGYWVHKRYPKMEKEDFIESNYGMEFDFSKIDKDEFVFIVDFSFELDVMRELLKKTKNIIWIDHHITAIEKYKDFEFDIKGLRYDGVAGCMLTWCYFNKMNDGRIPFETSMCNEAPWMTKYVHDHDVWRFDYGEETAQFKLGLDTKRETHPLSNIWEELLEIENVRKLISDGAIIEKYRDSLGEKACENYGFEYELGGHKTFCLNNVFGGSEWFGDLIKKYDMVCSYNMEKDKTWSYSLYSEKVDTSVISKSYGGGGHKGASGFSTKECIFTK